MKVTLYENQNTGELLTSHAEAMKQYNAGDSIKVFYEHNPQNFIIWEAPTKAGASVDDLKRVYSSSYTATGWADNVPAGARNDHSVTEADQFIVYDGAILDLLNYSDSVNWAYYLNYESMQVYAIPKVADCFACWMGNYSRYLRQLTNI